MLGCTWKSLSCVAWIVLTRAPAVQFTGYEMGTFNPAIVRGYLREATAGSSTHARGKAYEALAVHLFEAIPGCFAERDTINFFGTEQIDVAVGNSRVPDGLCLLPTVLIVECKDWARPVDSKTVGYFVNILANRGVEVGVLIAANGITGDPLELGRAHALGISAIARGIKVLLMTTAEIEKLCSAADLTELLNRRYLRAITSGGLGTPKLSSPTRSGG
jgi:hypothetical protein